VNGKDLSEFLEGPGIDWVAALLAHVGGDGVLLDGYFSAYKDLTRVGIESQFVAGGGVGDGAESI